MARTGKIRRLPPELRDILHRKLDEGCTLDEITAHLHALGADISRSGLGRYKQNFDKVASRLRDSREMAEAMIQKIGPEATEGRQGRLLVQMLTTLTGDYMFRRLQEGDDIDADEMKSLARALKDTTHAARLSQDFELKIREEIRKETEARLNEAMSKVAAETKNTSLSSPAELFEKVRAIYRGEA